jgi:hypothetical protein
MDLETAGLVAEGGVIALMAWVARRHYFAYLRMAGRWRAATSRVPNLARFGTPRNT